MMHELCKNCLGCENPMANIKLGKCPAQVVYVENEQIEIGDSNDIE